MGLALLFPGQGAQHPHMLPWLDARPEAQAPLNAMAAQLGVDWRDRLAAPDWLRTNAVAQPLLTGVNLAAWQVLAAQLPRPVAVAGYSVGELAAFAAAGVFDAATAVELASARARFMDGCASGPPTGLLALQGPGALAAAQASSGIAIAIRITPDRVIVGGTVERLDDGVATWSAAGLSCSRLPIGVASHTPAMAPAAAAFAERLTQTNLRAADVPVVCNLTGAATRRADALASALAGQIAHTVPWDDCMNSVAERGVRCVLEIGPGSALAAMWREQHPDIPARSVEEFQGPEGAVAWVRRMLDQS